jgi:hypothetical protein
MAFNVVFRFAPYFACGERQDATQKSFRSAIFHSPDFSSTSRMASLMGSDQLM